MEDKALFRLVFYYNFNANGNEYSLGLFEWNDFVYKRRSFKQIKR